MKTETVTNNRDKLLASAFNNKNNFENNIENNLRIFSNLLRRRLD